MRAVHEDVARLREELEEANKAHRAKVVFITEEYQKALQNSKEYHRQQVAEIRDRHRG